MGRIDRYPVDQAIDGDEFLLATTPEGTKLIPVTNFADSQSKVGYAEVVDGMLVLYSDSDKAHAVASVKLPSGGSGSGSGGSGLTESQIRSIITSYNYAKKSELPYAWTEAEIRTIAQQATGSGGGSGTGITVDNALSTTSLNPVQNKVISASINDILSRLGNLEYVPIAISSMSVSPGTVEKNTTATVTVSFAVNKQPSSLRIKQGSGSYTTLSNSTSGSKTYSVSSDTTWTLEAGDGKNTVTKTASVAFRDKIFYGVSATTSGFTDSWMTGLTSKFETSAKLASTNITAGTGQYIYFATPFSGTPTFVLGGFNTDFSMVGTVSHSNGVSYKIYRSPHSGVGATTLEVK